MPYSGFEPKPPRLQAESCTHHTGVAENNNCCCQGRKEKPEPETGWNSHTIDGDTAYLNLHNLGRELERRKYSPAPCTHGFSCDHPQDFWTHRFNEHALLVYSEGHLYRYADAFSEIEGTKRRGRPPIRWLDVVEKDLKLMGINQWKAIVTNRVNWGKISESDLACKRLLSL
ncbi:hypothetical protein TNCV_1812491 [Trichonephila clavipes]|uniref:Uncharacterized protein n=1 Tax=Trichonephila clavipes TaxID=2585209 RepID=A0A8X6W866_TRICX|nr:hypothetical protein TNCV_1812491 [Trichonephila clavipes]